MSRKMIAAHILFVWYVVNLAVLVVAPLLGLTLAHAIGEYFAAAGIVGLLSLVFADELRTHRQFKNAIARDEIENGPMREAYALEWHSRDGEP